MLPWFSHPILPKKSSDRQQQVMKQVLCVLRKHGEFCLAHVALCIKKYSLTIFNSSYCTWRPPMVHIPSSCIAKLYTVSSPLGHSDIKIPAYSKAVMAYLGNTVYQSVPLILCQHLAPIYWGIEIPLAYLSIYSRCKNYLHVLCGTHGISAARMHR